MFDCYRRPLSALLLAAALPTLAFAADKAKTKSTDDNTTPSYEQPQPAVENLDLTTYQRIREEGLMHSHIMEYGSALADDIGPRLTGSPNNAQNHARARQSHTPLGRVDAHP